LIDGPPVPADDHHASPRIPGYLPGNRSQQRAGQTAAPPVVLPCHGAEVSTTQTWPGAKVIGWPDAVVNVVPPFASGRDQRME
jgi:hypothetical protein